MAGENRVPRFELHIRPLMRLLDREHMLFKFDLWNYDDVRANAPNIIAFLAAGTMPPPPYGGPWPKEWIDLFQRWIDAGFPRLELGQASAAGYQATRSGAQITVVAKGRVASAGFKVWLDIQLAAADRREYELLQEPPLLGPGGPDKPFTARDGFETESAAFSVSVTDATGKHDVPIVEGAFLRLTGSAGHVRDRLFKLGFSVGEDAIHFNGFKLTVDADDLYTEVSGPADALGLFAERVGLPRNRWPAKQ